MSKLGEIGVQASLGKVRPGTEKGAWDDPDAGRGPRGACRARPMSEEAPRGQEAGS